MNNNTKKRFSSKKFRYGTSAVIFTAVFVVFVLLVNLLLSFVDGISGGLYVDLTSKSLYGVSDASVKALEGVDKPVEIIFCSPKDKIVDEDILNPISKLAESYEKSFDNVTVIYKDILSDVAYFNEFKKTSEDIIDSYSIIVNCPATGLSKIYSWSNMYKYNTEGILFAFDGENKITSAVLSVARSDDNMLTAGLITGHGEDTGHSLQHFLEDYGYTVSLVDLKTTESKELATYDVLVVAKPVFDFIGMKETVSSVPETDTADKTDQTPEDVTETGAVQTEEVQSEQSEQQETASVPEAKSVNEIEKLRDYVIEDYGNLFMFFDPNYANMPELFALVEDGFGVKMSNLYPVIDSGTLLSSSSYNYEDWRFLGSYSTDTESAGYKMHKGISSAGTGSLPAFGPSCLMDIPKSTVGSMEISPVVTASKNAVVMAGSEMAEVPFVPLMTLSRYTKLVNEHEVSGNAVICGSGAFLSELDNPSLANADLFKQMLIYTGNDSIISDIGFKVLDETSIEVTSQTSKNMMRNLGITIPVIIAVIGVVVFIKRKYL